MLTSVPIGCAATCGEQLAPHGHVVPAGSQNTEMPEYGPPAGSSTYQMTWSPLGPWTAVTTALTVKLGDAPASMNAWRALAMVVVAPESTMGTSGAASLMELSLPASAPLPLELLHAHTTLDTERRRMILRFMAPTYLGREPT
jgi:hypothetical protein